MTYSEALDFLYSQLPMFQRIGPAAYKPDLGNTIALCKALGNPERLFPSIHIAGTNGKGSTSHMLASVMQEAGLKTGLYTSPHLKDFRERIKINGRMITREYVRAFVVRNRQVFEKIQPSFFEMTVALAYEYFASKKVDVAIIETGLGGRLDSTNVITPVLSVITNISHDHNALLGDTLEKIAAEKAGIIKPGVPVVVGEYSASTAPVFKAKSKGSGSPICFADKKFRATVRKSTGSYRSWDISNSTGKTVISRVKLPLLGEYQQKNLITVFAAFDIVKGPLKLKQLHFREGVQRVLLNTGLRGRWDVLQKKPLVVCDTAHNEAGIKAVMTQIDHTPHKHLHIVLGIASDKDAGKLLTLLPENASYYFCQAQIPRAMPVAELQEKAFQNNLRGEAFASVREAKKAAVSAAGKRDLVFIGGSTFVVAEAI